MKRHNILILASAILLAANMFPFGATCAAQQTISFRADNYYPFNGDPSDAKPGYVVEILKVVFEKQGLKVDYQTMPWKRAVSEGESGNINGIIGALKADAPEFVFPEEPILLSPQMLFVKKGSAWKYTGLDSLKGTCLGVISGYSYGEKLDAYIKENEKNDKLVDVASGDTAVAQNIRKLKAGRIDAYVDLSQVVTANAIKLGMKPEEFAEAGAADEPVPMYVAFSPKKEDSKKLAKAFDEGIREMRKSGDLSKILAKYGLKDWK